MLTIHRINETKRVLEFRGSFLPQYTLNGNQWHYYHVGGFHVEFTSLVLAKQHIAEGV